ncbi:MAG: class I SAM-dependent methyltransferase [Bacilli bacterium]
MNYLLELKNKNIDIYPIKQLLLTKEKNFNLVRIKSLKELKTNLVYKSILNQLEILDTFNTKFKDIISEVILWSDVAKAGSSEERKKWVKNKYNLFCHNIGSSQIYKEHTNNYSELIYILIKTHGYIGQYLQGEVKLSTNIELYNLIENKIIKKEELKEILLILNECIIRDVSNNLYINIKNDIEKTIIKIVNNDFDNDEDIVLKLDRLNNGITSDDKNKINLIIQDNDIKVRLTNIFNNYELWYFKSALGSFSIEEQIKILLLLPYENKDLKVTFNSLMKSIYLDYKNIRRTNIYKQRIIQKYLSDMEYKQIINKQINDNINITYQNKIKNDVIEFNFIFSKVATKLIEFCEIAYESNSLYNKAVIMLYDLFGFRKDEYDRFYNEIEYLQTMNSSINHKAKLLEFIKGNNILDVGPGGGALMDLILDTYEDKNVYGIDISSNVIDELNKRKLKEKRKYNLVKGNALYLEKYFNEKSLDTIIFSSIIHELYSYIEFDGKRFNYDTIKKALKSAYNILDVGGRIIIRDGIMSSTNNKRIIEFKNSNDINILKKYKNDFKGRNIEYEIISDNKVLMNENDSMEFLYTYTWGDESYSLEVKEQFGYFNLNEYKKFILDNLENSKIVYSCEFLQSGYTDHLLNKISYYDEDMNTITLPNSTCIIVIEKGF